MPARTPFALAAAALMVVAGCAHSTPTSAAASSAAQTTTAVPLTVTSASAATSTSVAAARSRGSVMATSSAPGGGDNQSAGTVPLCTSDIRVIPGQAEGAAGHRTLVLVFNNVSRSTTCEIIGYPGVDLVTPSGATVAHLVRTLRGMAGGEPTGVSRPQPVILTPGASASALAEASDITQGGIIDCGSYGLRVTVPNQYVSVSGGTAKLPRCAAEIHPVVPGTSGGIR